MLFVVIADGAGNNKPKAAARRQTIVQHFSEPCQGQATRKNFCQVGFVACIRTSTMQLCCVVCKCAFNGLALVAIYVFAKSHDKQLNKQREYLITNIHFYHLQNISKLSMQPLKNFHTLIDSFFKKAQKPCTGIKSNTCARYLCTLCPPY